jgi:hypothetical protein
VAWLSRFRNLFDTISFSGSGATPGTNQPLPVDPVLPEILSRIVLGAIGVILDGCDESSFIPFG